MVPYIVTGDCFQQAFVFHVYLLYMNVEPHNYFMHYGGALNVKHATPMETQIAKE